MIPISTWYCPSATSQDNWAHIAAHLRSVRNVSAADRVRFSTLGRRLATRTGRICTTLCAQYIDSKNDIKRDFWANFFCHSKLNKKKDNFAVIFLARLCNCCAVWFGLGLLIGSRRASFKSIRVRLRTQSVLIMFQRKEIKRNVLPIKHIKIWHNSLTKITLILNYVQENRELRLPLPKIARFARKVGNTLSYSRENPWRQEANPKLFTRV